MCSKSQFTDTRLDMELPVMGVHVLHTANPWSHQEIRPYLSDSLADGNFKDKEFSTLGRLVEIEEHYIRLVRHKNEG